MMADTVRIGLTGDVMLGRLVDEHQRRRPVEAVWGNLLGRLQSLDGLFINLECCLSTRGEPWTQTHRPFHFRADPDWAVPALERAGVDAAAMANNHVLDYNEPALYDTLDELNAADIARAGAGRTVDAARQPAILDMGSIDVAFFSLTDNTPEYAAGPKSPGTAHVAIDQTDQETRNIVTESLEAATDTAPDFVIASLHWGPNMVTEPPDEFQSFARWLIDKGVDLIHGHSAHVFQGIEVLNDGIVLYDTGDFVDDYAVDPDLHNDRSFLFEVAVHSDDGGFEEVRLLPTEIYDYSVHEAGDDAAEWSRQRMRELSRPFGTSLERQGTTLVCQLRN